VSSQIFIDTNQESDQTKKEQVFLVFQIEKKCGCKVWSNLAMDSLTGFRMEPKWQIDPQLLFVGPKIGEGAHAKVYEGK